jgi:hypothetical protein
LVAGLLVNRLGVTQAIGTAGTSLALIALLAAVAMPALRRHAGR